MRPTSIQRARVMSRGLDVPEAVAARGVGAMAAAVEVTGAIGSTAPHHAVRAAGMHDWGPQATAGQRATLPSRPGRHGSVPLSTAQCRSVPQRVLQLDEQLVRVEGPASPSGDRVDRALIVVVDDEQIAGWSECPPQTRIRPHVATLAVVLNEAV